MSSAERTEEGLSRRSINLWLEDRSSGSPCLSTSAGVCPALFGRRNTSNRGTLRAAVKAAKSVSRVVIGFATLAGAAPGRAELLNKKRMDTNWPEGALPA